MNERDNRFLQNPQPGQIGGFNAPPVAPHDFEHEDDENADMRGYIKGNDFALPYMSAWSRLHLSGDDGDQVKRNKLLAQLRHVNCGHLSTFGEAPTMLALKQHAQSLLLLIKLVCPTLAAGEVLTGKSLQQDQDEQRTKNKGKGKAGVVSPFAAVAEDDTRMQDAAVGDNNDLEATRELSEPVRTVQEAYALGDAFDFLNDLDTPYYNAHPSHHEPLWALSNEVRERHEATGNQYHCPFAESVARPVPSGLPADTTTTTTDQQTPVKPYATHYNLIVHANACLERLDHEFSSVGGLLGMLPSDQPRDGDGLAHARNTLLGQWLIHTQHLVARMRELELDLANALDVLEKESVVPAQVLGQVGPDGRAAGRTVAFPQDRYVLVNAGNDVWASLHKELDQREALVAEKEHIWKKNGVLGVDGPEVWMRERGGEEYARGIVPVNMDTRYYRLRGQGHQTIFIVPGWAQHPGIQQTIAAEARPKLVASVQPRFPARASALEARFNARMTAAARLELENLQQARELERLERANRTLTAEVRRHAVAQDGLVNALGASGTNVDHAHEHAAAQVHLEAQRRRVAELEAAQEKAAEEKREQERYVAQLEAETRKLQGEVKLAHALRDEATAKMRAGGAADAQAADRAAGEQRLREVISRPFLGARHTSIFGDPERGDGC